MKDWRGFMNKMLGHRHDVSRCLSVLVESLMDRSVCHDLDKFHPEVVDKHCEMFENFQKNRPPYGTPEYDQVRERFAQILERHYQANRHHPEHFRNGIEGMNLVDVMEMVCDWVAATPKDQDLFDAVGLNCSKYGIDRQLMCLIVKTILDYQLKEVLDGSSHNENTA